MRLSTGRRAPCFMPLNKRVRAVDFFANWPPGYLLQHSINAQARLLGSSGPAFNG